MADINEVKLKAKQMHQQGSSQDELREYVKFQGYTSEQIRKHKIAEPKLSEFKLPKLMESGVPIPPQLTATPETQKYDIEKVPGTPYTKITPEPEKKTKGRLTWKDAWGLSKLMSKSDKESFKKMKRDFPTQYLQFEQAMQTKGMRDKLGVLGRAAIDYNALLKKVSGGVLKGTTFGAMDEKTIENLLKKMPGMKEKLKIVEQLENVPALQKAGGLLKAGGEIGGAVFGAGQIGKILKGAKTFQAKNKLKALLKLRGTTAGISSGARNIVEAVKGGKSPKDAVRDTLISMAATSFGMIPENIVKPGLGNVLAQITGDVAFDVVTDLSLGRATTEDLVKGEYWKEKGLNNAAGVFFALDDYKNRKGSFPQQQADVKAGFREMFPQKVKPVDIATKLNDDLNIARGIETPETVNMKNLTPEQAVKAEYELQKDLWIGNEDVRLAKAKNEKGQFQETIKTALGEKRYNDRVKKFDEAIQIYREIKNNPEIVNKYFSQLKPEQQEIVDLAMKLPDNLKKVADLQEESYKTLGLEALDKNIIRNLKENYASRVWDFEGKKGEQAGRKFGTTTRHAQQRIFNDGIIEGWAKGFETKVKGSTSNLELYKQELIKTIEDKRFIDHLSKIKTVDGDALISEKQLEGYVRVEHPNFKKWKWVGKAKEGEVASKNFRIDNEGNMFERKDMYAPQKIAKNINNMLNISAWKGNKFGDFITKGNANIKSFVLQSSLFHHMAFMRSYYLGTAGGIFKKGTPRQAYRKGIEQIKSMTPIIEQGIRNGLTLGLKQDWDETVLRQQGKIANMLDKMKVTKYVKDKIMALKRANEDFLFGKFGAGLKANAFTLEYEALLKKYPGDDPDKLAKIAANLINDDFGGLHLKRMGRNQTWQHAFRLLALAPDWTESNVRSMVKAFKSGREGEVYRTFWSRVFTRGIGLTVLANLLLHGEEYPEKFKKAWKEGGLKFMDVDITPLYNAFGGKKKGQKFFSIVGHFRDVFKFAAHPLRSAQHKGSYLFNTIYEALSGVDWAGRKFTELSELLKTGKTVDYKSGKGGPIEWSQMMSYIANKVKSTQPIQVQNLIGWMEGTTDGFDAVANSLGLGVRTGYKGRAEEEAKARPKAVSPFSRFTLPGQEPEEGVGKTSLQKLAQLEKKKQIATEAGAKLKLPPVGLGLRPEGVLPPVGPQFKRGATAEVEGVYRSVTDAQRAIRQIQASKLPKERKEQLIKRIKKIQAKLAMQQFLKRTK